MTKEEFKAVRNAHGLTQKAMAELLGVKANYVSRLERPSDTTTPITPRIEKLVRLIFRGKK
jgi:transcriptional regulator with XRE-family HTH domain